MRIGALLGRLVLASVAAVLAACSATAPSPTAGPSATPSITPPGASATATPGASPSAPSANACDYVPGNTLATMPDDLGEPEPTPDVPLPSPSAVDQATLDMQLEVFEALVDIVPDSYIDDGLNGVDWPALAAEYRAIVERGHSEADLETILNLMVAELGDDHSYVQSETSVREFQEQLAGEADYVGVGIYVQPDEAAGRGIILAVFPDSPAQRAGLRAHDAITAVDGQSVLNADGTLDIERIRGLPDTEVTLTIERPGEPAREVTIQRAPIAGSLPIRACLVSGTGIAYVMVPCLCDLTITDQVSSALAELAAEQPLRGLVLDNRINGGGDERILRGLLALFVDGELGAFDGVFGSRPLSIDGEDVAGSQGLPLAVLVGDPTASYGEVLSGVIQASDDGLVIGSTTDGNVETLRGYDLEHGWQLWLAGEAFQSADADYGPWEETGIVPDIEVPTRWDLFTEATDPALAAAVEALLERAGQP